MFLDERKQNFKTVIILQTLSKIDNERFEESTNKQTKFYHDLRKTYTVKNYPLEIKICD